MDERLGLWPVGSTGEDGGAVPGVRDLSQDRLQDFCRYKDCGVEGLTDRSRRPTACPPAPLPDREGHHPVQAGAPQLGAPRSVNGCAASTQRWQCPAIKHRARDPGSARLVRPTSTGLQARGHTALAPPTRRTICGAPITRASSCSPIGATATRSPSPTSPAATDHLRGLENTRATYAFTVFERAFKDFAYRSDSHR